MTHLKIRGGRPLSGRIVPSANKNAVLPILCATLLTDRPVRLIGIPDITDVRRLLDFFRSLGSDVHADFEVGTLDLRHRHACFDAQQHRLPQAMRASVMLVPPLLARFGQARLEADVKGCSLGAREIDPHIEVLMRFGAHVTRDDDAIGFDAPHRGLVANHHWLDYASVTTTENFVLCAANAPGVSTLTNAACEPHVQEFCRFMQIMGVKIEGVGTSRLTINGSSGLRGTQAGPIVFRFAHDFHEVVTFLALGAIPGGEIEVMNDAPEQFPLIDRVFAKLGVEVIHEDGWSRARLIGDKLAVQAPFTPNVLTKIEAAPWPYLAVDLLPIFIALGVRAEGSAMFWNKVYDGALGWTSELAKFGAHAVLADPHRLVTFGGLPLTPARVESPYIIRVAIALLMVAASTDGESEILNAAPIRRAHPGFVENLRRLGADIRWSDEIQRPAAPVTNAGASLV